MWLEFKFCSSYCYFRGEILFYFVFRGEGSSIFGRVLCYEIGISFGRMGFFVYVRFVLFFVFIF